MKPEPLPSQASDLADSLVGVWGLVSREDYDAKGNRLIDPHLGADPSGILCFSKEYFSAQFSKRDRSELSSVPSALTADNTSAVGGYDAYFGRYWIDETGEAIVVHLQGSLTPANTGQELTRAVRASESRLIIRLSTSADDGTALTRTLTFERLP